ncbi:uncharacterized protein KY384_008848 [Bacidia gigantensis]|uniref:uncharacterized protein n=1 Tax=Bacidia gigantensis TaxID=2732470 RepID=UPI001D05ABBF|nr:uncharacterized protein KY384_008848 [Bacidia gigantensis]KAG8525204.1 hypothetical protein KY384_008848 [Bacidia gigantensis]
MVTSRSLILRAPDGLSTGYSSSSNTQLPPGYICFHSSSVPDLTSDVTYTATFTQSVSVTKGNQTAHYSDLKSKKTFNSPVSPYALDPSSIHSVYPPPGHSIYWNALPHILFDDKNAPWLLKVRTSETASDQTPWLALLVFTADELSITEAQKTAFNQKLAPNGGNALNQTSTLSYKLKAQDIQKLNGVATQPTSLTDQALKTDVTPVEIIVLQGALFASLFAGKDAKSTDAPDPVRFKLMSHIRTFNTTGMANTDDPGVYDLAAINSPRIGPYDLTSPKTAFAHVVSLQGLFDNSNVTRDGTKPAVLTSLYSWSFTYLPSESFSAQKLLQALGDTVQPLRPLDASFQKVQAQDSLAKYTSTSQDNWTKDKMLSGYSLLRYRTPTGEPTIALQRGFLTPTKYDDFDFPPSDYGTDLAIVDEQSGFMDLTFQIAWELGKTMAVADRAFSSALMRLRKGVHDKFLDDAKVAKATAQGVFIAKASAPAAFATANSTVVTRLNTQSAFKSQRWSTQPLGYNQRELYAFTDSIVKTTYRQQLQSQGISVLAEAVPASQQSQKPAPNSQVPADTETKFNEYNVPQSTDYATVLQWLMDRWYLFGLPFANLVSDPGFIPNETVRSFYVDQNWFKTFTDGALSICEHFDEGDDVREALKLSLHKYVSEPLLSGAGKGFVPQVPKWGILLRSEFVTKFPDMRLSAPFVDSKKQGVQLEVIRHERIDTDLLLMLFDREPGDFSDLGITISPPEHQLTSIVGDDDGLNGGKTLTIVLKPVFSDLATSGISSKYNNTRPTILIDPATVSDYFDSNSRALYPQSLANVASSASQLGSTKYARAAFVAAQLVASVPALNMLKPGAQRTIAAPASLITSKQRVLPALKPAPARRPLRSVEGASQLPTYATPVNQMIRALAKTDLQVTEDNIVIGTFFVLYQIPNIFNPGPKLQAPEVRQARRKNTPYIQSQQCQLSTDVYNLRFAQSTNPDSGPYQIGLVSLYPLSLGFKTDLQIDTKSLATSRYDLSRLSFWISVGPCTPGNTPTTLLAPFPDNKPPSTLTPNALGEWPAQPASSGSKAYGVILPKVRTVGLGCRWRAQTSYTAAKGNTPATFTIDLWPNNKSGLDYPIVPAWDLLRHKDASIVVEGVQVNCFEGLQPNYLGAGSSAVNFQMPIYEEYTNHDGSSYSVGTYTNVITYGVDCSNWGSYAIRDVNNVTKTCKPLFYATSSVELGNQLDLARQDQTTVWVPMKLDAYLNSGPQYESQSDPRERAYLAPFNDPNFQGLQLDSRNLQNDIFEHHKSAPYMGAVDRTRKQQRRQGVGRYLHWSLPKMYRVGLAASDSTDSKKSMTDQARLAGYPENNIQPGQPLFRPIPNRWFVWRTVRGARGTKYNNQIWIKNKSDGTERQYTFYDSNASEFAAVRDCFMVESVSSSYPTPFAKSLQRQAETIWSQTDFNLTQTQDRIRSITDQTAIPPTEDIEVSATPFVNTSAPLSEQGQLFMGKASWINGPPGWDGNDNQPPSNPTPITVQRVGNPYFPDFQPQNSSVLSFFDDLSVRGQDAVFCQGSISYTVVGYHTRTLDDPLFLDMNYDKGQTPQQRLDACSLKIDNQLNSDDTTWKDAALNPATQASMRTLCYGNMFNLTWSNPKSEEAVRADFVTPADVLQKSLVTSHPVSVGTNPIDALFGWLRSTEDTGVKSTDDIKRSLLKIQTLVLDYNDNIDSQFSAEDLLATNNFVPSAGGAAWHFKAPDDSKVTTQPVIPTPQQALDLRTLNMIQSRLNAIIREQQRLKCELFCAWWTYVADKDNTQVSAFNTAINQVPDLQKRIKANADYKNGNVGAIATLNAAIATQKAKLGLLQVGQHPSFYIQRDPTLFLAGLSSKWPSDWDQNLQVRINPQNFMGGEPMGFPKFPRFQPSDMPTGKLPTALNDTISKIISEGEFGSIGQVPFRSTPKYFGGQDTQSLRNGWFPLFIEWEAEYYHIPFDQWQFTARGKDARYGYGLTPDSNPADPNTQGDFRLLKGRCPILPQAGSILAATLKQIFSKDPDNPMSTSDRDNLIKQASSLDFLSSPMTGLTEQLVTCVQGLHTLPVKNTTSGPQMLPGAPGANIGFSAPEDFTVMAGATSKTPFASLVDIPADPNKYSPFKPCIHGQLRFTKLNIIDKFNQIVQGIQTYSDLGKGIGPTPTPLFPCLGDSYSVDYSNDGSSPKIVLPRQNGDTKCPFIQLPPSINQNARVNAHFLTEDAAPTWRSLDEWENPVRGWLVINQANRSLQVFTFDGRFVREYAVESKYPLKRPFAEDQTLLNSLDPVLKSFMTQFVRPGYLQGVFRTLTEVTEAIQATPSSYADSMLSVLGRPLALTTFGINLELAESPLKNKSTVANKVSPKDLTSYNFGLKIGDKDNVYDGLYGYFTTAPDLKNGVDVNWNDFYTYHPRPPTTLPSPATHLAPCLKT